MESLLILAGLYGAGKYMRGRRLRTEIPKHIAPVDLAREQEALFGNAYRLQTKSLDPTDTQFAGRNVHRGRQRYLISNPQMPVQYTTTQSKQHTIRERPDYRHYNIKREDQAPLSTAVTGGDEAAMNLANTTRARNKAAAETYLAPLRGPSSFAPVTSRPEDGAGLMETIRPIQRERAVARPAAKHSTDHLYDRDLSGRIGTPEPHGGTQRYFNTQAKRKNNEAMFTQSLPVYGRADNAHTTLSQATTRRGERKYEEVRFERPQAFGAPVAAPVVAFAQDTSVADTRHHGISGPSARPMDAYITPYKERTVHGRTALAAIDGSHDRLPDTSPYKSRYTQKYIR
jgi:hypothetical protein